MSAASSACDHIYNWVNGTPKDTWVSMGVYSDGSYNAPKVHLKQPALVFPADKLLTVGKHLHLFCVSQLA